MHLLLLHNVANILPLLTDATCLAIIPCFSHPLASFSPCMFYLSRESRKGALRPSLHHISPASLLRLCLFISCAFVSYTFTLGTHMSPSHLCMPAHKLIHACVLFNSKSVRFLACSCVNALTYVFKPITPLYSFTHPLLSDLKLSL